MDTQRRGQVGLRLRWIYNGIDQRLICSRHLPKGAKLESVVDDGRPPPSQPPPVSTNLLLVCDVMFVGAIGKCMQTGWNFVAHVAGQSPNVPSGYYFLVYLAFFFRPILPIFFMWMFANLMLMWFHMGSTKMPIEYGGDNATFKTAELILLPTIVCILGVALNDPVCLYSYTVPNHPFWNERSTDCGYFKFGNTTVTAAPGFWPAEPCKQLTLGSCVYSSVAKLSFRMFALGLIMYVKRRLSAKDYICAGRTLNWWFAAQSLSAIWHAVEMIGSWRAGSKITKHDDINDKLVPVYFQHLISIFGVNQSKASLIDDFYIWSVFTVMLSTFTQLLPYLWMCYHDRKGLKKYTLPLDAEFMQGRSQLVFKIVLAKLLLVSLLSDVHNGEFLDFETHEYRMSWSRNLMPIVGGPLLVWGFKMLYYDTAAGKYSPFGANQHAISVGHVRAMMWFLLNFLAVGFSGVLTQCFMDLIKFGAWAPVYKDRLFGLSISGLLYVLACKQWIHKLNEDKSRMRQTRRGVLRALCATAVLMKSVFGVDRNHTRKWIFIVVPFLIGWIERALDRWCHSSWWKLSCVMTCECDEPDNSSPLYDLNQKLLQHDVKAPEALRWFVSEPDMELQQCNGQSGLEMGYGRGPRPPKESESDGAVVAQVDIGGDDGDGGGDGGGDAGDGD